MSQYQTSNTSVINRISTQFLWKCALLCIFLSIAISANAQNLKGIVLDATTGDPLPSANIIIKDTYTGTISNSDGLFELRTKALPLTLLVRYIGYHSQEIEIDEITDANLVIRLEPNIRELGEVTVTGGNPADDIMREVIRRKQIWRASLETYSAQAYTRQRLESNQEIATITETLSDVFWDKEKGPREVIRSKRQTANLGFEDNFAAAGFIPNFYDDNLDIGGFTMVGPTHPDAFRFYNFELVGLRSLDDLTVFDIKVTSRRRLQPTFEGMIAVVDSAYALLEIDLKPNDALIFPPPIQKFNLYYTQQFSNFGGDYWLPVDVRIRGEIKFGIIGLQFPEIGVQQLSRLTDYQVNTILPDTLYAENTRRLRVDTVSVKRDSLFLRSAIVVPLTGDEMKAYEEIDSTSTLDKAFQPTGFLARFVNTDDDSDGSSVSVGGGNRRSNRINFKGSLSPDARFTRVDGLFLGANVTYPVVKGLQAQAGGGYSIAAESYDYQFGLRVRHPKSPRLTQTLRYETGNRSRYRNSTSSILLSSPSMILGNADYFDYYRIDGVSLKTDYRMRSSRGNWSLTLRNEEHSSLAKVTDYSLLYPSTIQRPNPAIDEGMLRSLELGYVLGGDRTPFAIIGQNRVEIRAEWSNPDLFNSDFSYGSYQIAIDRRIPTFYKRRFIPNTLELRLLAGTSTGTLPLQRFGVVDASPGYYTEFGSLKTHASTPYEGEHFLGLHWEHNFRTIPFEAVGMRWLARKGYGIIVYGSHARSFISDDRLQALQAREDFMLSYTGNMHHEVGISLNGIFGLGRINITQRLDAPGLRVGFAVARYF